MTICTHTFTLKDCRVAPERTITSSTFDCEDNQGVKKKRIIKLRDAEQYVKHN